MKNDPSYRSRKEKCCIVSDNGNAFHIFVLYRNPQPFE